MATLVQTAMAVRMAGSCHGGSNDHLSSNGCLGPDAHFGSNHHGGSHGHLGSNGHGSSNAKFGSNGHGSSNDQLRSNGLLGPSAHFSLNTVGRWSKWGQHNAYGGSAVQMLAGLCKCWLGCANSATAP